MLPDDARKLEKLYGQVSSEQFFGGNELNMVPFPDAGKSKTHRNYDEQAVGESLRRNPPELVDIDPRTLHASQTRVTKGGVDYYSNPENYERSGETYADQGQKANQFPVVYTREEPSGVTRNIILSGHHRATAALLQGRPLRAVNPRGGFGQAWDS